MYDPLKERHPGNHKDYPKTYWSDTAGVANTSHLEDDLTVDVAIIGGGYTGLATAYHLASKYNIGSTVLEANPFGWGCSGRNAGFALQSTGRLGMSQLAKKFGMDVAKGMYGEYRGGLDKLKQFISEHDLQCDPQYSGFVKLAHKASLDKSLRDQAHFLQSNFGDSARYLDKSSLSKELVNTEEATSGLYFPDCFGLHPLKLSLEYVRLLLGLDVNLYSQSPAIDIVKQGNKHLITTPKGRVSAKKLVFASNGYTPKGLHNTVNNRILPVLSSIIVTNPLTDDELAGTAIKPGLVMMDTRELKYYYRLLPDNRILFGGRGAIQGKHADNPIFTDRLLQALKKTFPSCKRAEVDYAWSGWISVSLDELPRITAASDDPSIFYSMGYCGSGVSFTHQAGFRLAQLIAGDHRLPELPILNQTLKTFPLPQFRRMGQWGFYQWGRFKDAYL